MRVHVIASGKHPNYTIKKILTDKTREESEYALNHGGIYLSDISTQESGLDIEVKEDEKMEREMILDLSTSKFVDLIKIGHISVGSESIKYNGEDLSCANVKEK